MTMLGHILRKMRHCALFWETNNECSPAGSGVGCFACFAFFIIAALPPGGGGVQNMQNGPYTGAWLWDFMRLDMQGVSVDPRVPVWGRPKGVFPRKTA